jgi:hypothetical protein
MGLPQLPREVLWRARVAAIGPATARALKAGGVQVDVTARSGYTSEALLDTLARESAADPDERTAFIMAAPGGREALADGLARLGWRTRFIMVYKPHLVPDLPGRLGGHIGAAAAPRQGVRPVADPSGRRPRQRRHSGRDQGAVLNQAPNQQNGCQ